MNQTNKKQEIKQMRQILGVEMVNDSLQIPNMKNNNS